MRHIPLRLWALSLSSALLQLVPFPLAGPVSLWRRLVVWVCLVPLLMAFEGRDTQGKTLSVWQSAALGYACATLWFLGNCYWIYQTMFHYGGLPTIASAGILVLFSLYLGLYGGLLGALYGLLQKQGSVQRARLLFPVLWVAVELARTRITGFPWDLLGYTEVENYTLTPLATWTGVMGLSFLVAAGNAAWLWRPDAQRTRGLQAASPWMALGLGLAVTQGVSPLLAPHAAPAEAAAVLLQENLNVGADAATGEHESQAAMVRNFAALTAHPIVAPGVAATRQPDLLAWPEAPTSFADADPGLREALGTVARTARAPLVVDAVGLGQTPNSLGRYDEYVSASFYLPDGSYAGRYDKMHLVPFGEYTPYKQLFFFVGHLLDGLNFVPGTQRRVFSVNGHRLGVFICYESIFGDEVREFARDGAQVLVNLSDDGWYGDTSAPWEHLDMARMRAIENRRWVLRDTNTGLTTAIDPEGRLVASLPRHVQEAIEVPFGFRTDLTFYTRHGDWLGWLCALMTLAACFGPYLQTKYARSSVGQGA